MTHRCASNPLSGRSPEQGSLLQLTKQSVQQRAGGGGAACRRRHRLAPSSPRRPPGTAPPQQGVHAHGRRGRPTAPIPLPCTLPLSPTPHACPHVPLHAVPGRERTVARSTEKRNTAVVPKVTQTNKLPDVVPMLLRKRDTNLTGNRHTILHTVIAIPLSHFRRARKNKFRAKVT